MLKMQQAASCRENVRCSRKKGQMKKMDTKAKSVPLPITPAAPCNAPLAGERVLSKSPLHLGREKVWDTYKMVIPSTQLRQHPAADTPQPALRGCHSLDKMSEYSPKG